MDDISKALVQSVVNSKKDVVVIFYENEPIVTNTAFHKFFNVTSLEQYKSDFGPFVNNFVPHPSYFNQDKIARGESWFEAIMKIDEQDRIVSMMNAKYEPHAFLVDIDMSIENYVVASFEDITQSLIKRIMIQNHATTDEESGAYSHNYFSQIMSSFDDAAAFNEKVIGITFFGIVSNDGVEVVLEEETLKAFVEYFKGGIRQDDMIVRWNDSSFLLVYLVDDDVKANQVAQKLQTMARKKIVKDFKCNFTHRVQKGKESIVKLLKNLDS
jgi:GGDEF domain-containing protein